MQAFEGLSRTAGMPASVSLQTSAFGPQTPSPMSAPVTLKRNFPFETYTGREIRPKPSTGGAYGQPSPIEQPPKKKRGRPTKAEAAARAEAYGPSSEPSTVRRAVSVGSSFPAPAAAVAPEPTEAIATDTYSIEQTRPLQPPVSGMSISSMLTPAAPKTASQSSSSSGKRRRGRSTRSEPEDLPRAGTSGAATPSFGRRQEYESPYARMATESQDTPARAAVVRHREEHPPDPLSPLQPPQPSQQEIPAPPPTSAPKPPRSL